jgi:hypothetical protein
MGMNFIGRAVGVPERRGERALSWNCTWNRPSATNTGPHPRLAPNSEAPQ